jgi:phage baseplate assembly protein W
MRPEFGCRVHELLFAPNNAATEGLLIHYVKEALDRWEPRIEVKAIEVTTDPNSGATLLAEVKYKIRDTHNERSIVYPFFLMGEEE